MNTDYLKNWQKRGNEEELQRPNKLQADVESEDNKET